MKWVGYAIGAVGAYFLLRRFLPQGEALPGLPPEKTPSSPPYGGGGGGWYPMPTAGGSGATSGPVQPLPPPPPAPPPLPPTAPPLPPPFALPAQLYTPAQRTYVDVQAPASPVPAQLAASSPLAIPSVAKVVAEVSRKGG